MFPLARTNLYLDNPGLFPLFQNRTNEVIRIHVLVGKVVDLCRTKDRERTRPQNLPIVEDRLEVILYQILNGNNRSIGIRNRNKPIQLIRDFDVPNGLFVPMGRNDKHVHASVDVGMPGLIYCDRKQSGIHRTLEVGRCPLLLVLVQILQLPNQFDLFVESMKAFHKEFVVVADCIHQVGYLLVGFQLNGGRVTYHKELIQITECDPMEHDLISKGMALLLGFIVHPFVERQPGYIAIQ